MLRRVLQSADRLWIEEKVVWSALLVTVVLFRLTDYPFSVTRVAGPYALFLGRIAAVVALITAVHRAWLRWVRRRPAEPFTLDDVTRFLRTLGFYLVALTTYTNLKTHTLLLNPRVYDGALETLDRWMFLGASPTELALRLTEHSSLTPVMDAAYTYAWVPLALTFGVVFSLSGGEGFRRLARVISLNYLVGAALYVLLPAVGPAFAERELYEHLRQSRSFLIQNALISVHNQLIAAPREFLAPAFMGIAAFPSLHVSHIYLPLVVAWRRVRWLLPILVPSFLAVALSTLYFGWHWAIDIPAGMATIHLCFWLAGRMERAEQAARERRARRRRPVRAEGSGGGLGQWPAVAVLALLHLFGLLVSLGALAPGSPLTWGSGAALVFFLFFWVLLEFCAVVTLVALLEPRRLGDRSRLGDLGKAALLAALLTLSVASLLKLLLTGSHLAPVDLWFLTTNFAQLAGEIGLLEVLALLALGLLLGAVSLGLYRAFRRLRERPAQMPRRSFALLALLALLGAGYPVYRYPEARYMATRVVPELGWLAGSPVPTTPPTGEAPPLDGPPIEPWEPPTPTERPNVLLVMLESVPGNLLESSEITRAAPNLVALGDTSITFTRPYAPSVHSDYAQMAILSSLHPRKYPVHDYYERLDYPRTLLWDLLRPAGWRTAMFSCQNENWGNMISYLRTPGLELLRHSLDWPTAPRRGRGSESKVYEPTVVGAWQEWLDADPDRPWMAYLNFQATHFPYETPASAPRPFRPDVLDFPASFLHYPRDQIPVVRNRYLNALHYSDYYVGELVRILKQRGEWDQTLLIVVSDHGEAFYEHGQPTHGTTLHEEQVRSLLMVRLPGSAGRIVDEPVDLLDVVPSVTRHLGLPPHGNLQGRDDILESDYVAGERPFYFTIQGITSEDAILSDGWKYIANWRTGATSLYDLAGDPGETRDLASREPERAEALAARLSRFISRQLSYYAGRGWTGGRYPPPLD